MLVESELVVLSTFTLSKVVEVDRLTLDVEEAVFTEVVLVDVDVWPRGNIFPSRISWRT